MLCKINTLAIDSGFDEARNDHRQVFLWDTEIKGFGCRITPEGKVSWLVQKWKGGVGGKASRITIGRTPIMNITKARDKALIVIGQHAEGIDLVSRKKAKLQQERAAIQALSFGELFELYHKERDDKTRYWTEVKRIFNKEIPKSIANISILVITKEDIRGVIKALNHKEGTQRWLFVALRSFFVWCVQEDYISTSPMNDLKPPSAAPERERILSGVEIKVFWDAATQLRYPFEPFYKLLLLTGQRRNEVSDMQWKEWKESMWLIPKERTKTDNTHLVHLSDFALQVLKTVPSNHSDYIFTTTQRTPIQGFGKSKMALDHQMEISDWRIHDLRRTVSSGMAQLGVAPHVIDKCLNHTINSKVRRIYQRFEYLDERREAFNKWSEYVYNLVGASD